MLCKTPFPMKKLLLLFSIALLPFVVVIIVNETSMKPSTAVNEAYCTRICHNRGCLHFNKKRLNKNNSGFVARHYGSYKRNIDWLKNNPFSLSYVEINLLLYVILFPVVSVLLLWRLIKKSPQALGKEI